MLYYFIQVAVLQMVFLAFYYLFLHRETFFKLNRIYLIITGLIAFIIPIIKIQWPTQNHIWIEQLSPVIIGSKQLEQNIYQNVESQYAGIFLWIYIAGVLFFTTLFLYKLWYIFSLIKGNKTVKKNHYTLVLLPEQKEVFSFIRYVFISETLYQNNTLDIISHEIVHLKEKHWLDLLVFELLKIALWFNPLIRIYQKEISLLHEYIADQSVLKHKTYKDYFDRILQEHFQVRKISFINQFYKPSQLKKRIMMQKRTPSRHWKKIKYATFILILIGITGLIDACKQESQSVEKNLTETEFKQMHPEKKTSNDDKLPKADNSNQTNDEEKAFRYVQIPPEFPDCENATDKKACFSQEIQKFVSNHFNTDLAKKLHLNGKKVKILTMFTFDKTGQVTNIKARSKYKDLENEAKRVIALLPKVKPGMQDGKTVKVTYTLPIIFKMEE